MTAGTAALVEQLDGQFRVQRVEFDAPIGREVLVEVRAAGLCHSDLNVATIDRGRVLPLIPGHELAGVVLAVGPDVSTLQPGDHVVGTEVRACGECAACAASIPTLCAAPWRLERSADERPRVTQRGRRIHTLGVSAFASHSLADERQFVRVPTALPFAQACVLGCGVTTGLGAVANVARVRQGESVAVFGVGGVGLNMIIGARLAGAGRIVAVDLDAAKLVLAQQFGATHTLDGAVAGPAVWDAIDAAHVFDAVGAPAVTRQAIRATARGGSTYLIGIPGSNTPLELDTMRELIGAQRSLRGVYMGGTVPQRDIPRYAELYLSGELPLDELIAGRVGIADVTRAYTRPAAGARTVITDFTGREPDEGRELPGADPYRTPQESEMHT